MRYFTSSIRHCVIEFLALNNVSIDNEDDLEEADDGSLSEALWGWVEKHTDSPEEGCKMDIMSEWLNAVGFPDQRASDYLFQIHYQDFENKTVADLINTEYY
jgi:hypothetical protein